MLGSELNDVAFYCKYDEVGLGVDSKCLHNPVLVKGHGARRDAQDAGSFPHGLPFG
jgi:hypothetical protein